MTTMMTLAQAHALLQPRIAAARLVGDGAVPLVRVHTDTRTLQAGDLFVALKGERFDANAFLADARTGGAAAAIAHGGLEAAGLAVKRHVFTQAAQWPDALLQPGTNPCPCAVQVQEQFRLFFEATRCPAST